MTESVEEQGKGLHVRDILTKVLDDLKNVLGGTEVTFAGKVRTEVADDSDWHRTRVGYSYHVSAFYTRVGDRNWALSLGTAEGYPADPYSHDITAVLISPDGKTDEEIKAEIAQGLSKSSYYRSALIIAMSDGRLVANIYGHFGRLVLDPLTSKIREFIAQDVVVDPDLLTMDLRPVVRSPVYYREELVGFLSEIIQKALQTVPTYWK